MSAQRAATTGATGWPGVGWERHDWVPSTAWGVEADRRPTPTPYDAAVPPAIATLTPTLDASTAAAVEDAGRELSRFDAELGARVSSFAPVLLRSEAASSSQIENLTASARAIFSAELGVHRSRNADLIAANTRSMQAAIDLASDVSVDAVLEMHRVLMEAQQQHTPGEFRTEAVWIGTRADSPVGAEFVAPHHTRVGELMADLTAFCRRRDIPTLAMVALAHAQIETIHPFTDGNGRTGRALAQALLRATGATRNVAVPVSAGLLADVEGYHRALTRYREGDPQPIIDAFCQATLRAVGNARLLVGELDQIRDSWNSRVTARSNSNAWKLLDVAIRRPVLNASTAADELGIRRPNVYPPLNALVSAGILKSKHEHRQGPFWRSEEVLDAIDAFASRAGKREAV